MTCIKPHPCNVFTIIIILFEYHYKKVQSSTKCMGIQ